MTVLRQIQEEIAGMRREMDRRFQAVDDRFEHVDARFDQIADMFTTLIEAQATTTRRVTIMEKVIAGH